LNLYKKFRDLIPDPPLLVGDVVAISNGVATIEEPGGGRSQARGEALVGDRVFFRDGAIEGPAPTLSVVLIDV
jgi:hypothetical protein